MGDPMHDCEVAIEAAAAGAAVVSELFGSQLDRFDKGAGDFATAADIESERAMTGVIHRERPDDAVLGEENGRSGANGALRLWLIDPLCGTLNYACGMQVVAVNVALSGNDRFLAAAVADPFARQVFWTDGLSAFTRFRGEDRQVIPHTRSRLVDLDIHPTFRHPPERIARLACDEEFLGMFDPRLVSSSIALAWVATGQRAGYVSEGDKRNNVHFAAPIAICEAAGCVLSDLNGTPWRSGADGLIAGADAATHAALLRMVRKRRLL